jgi:hypothetical protein
MSDTTRLKQIFSANMEKIEIGTTLAHKQTQWVVMRHKFYDGSVSITLRNGKRERNVLIPICITGPCLADADLHMVKPAPMQRILSLNGSAA